MGCMSDRTLLLVDGSSYLYRAYHALPDLRGPGGVPTGAIRGVVSMMKLLREQYPAAHGACVFDDKGKTFRDDWYPEYKATRTAMPDDLALQIEPIHEAVKLLGWPVLMVPGIEADDAIGTISCMAAKGGFQVVISTGDKDLAQLVNENVVLINTMSNERLDVEGVAAKFGVAPERIVDYLALIGDSVDNIPGVEKVGPKTAVKWLAEHGSLEGVMAAAGGMKGVVGENLRKALDWLPQGRRLVTVATDCDLSGHVMGWPEFDGLALRPIEVDALLAFYDRYGFASMRKELEVSLGRAPTAAAPPARASAAAAAIDVADAVPSEDIVRNYETVTTLGALDAWVARLEGAELTALDLQTDSLDPIRARLIGISLSVAVGEACYVPIGHSYAGAPDQLSLETVLARLGPWLESPAAAKVGHNTKYDAHVLAGAGIAVRGYAHDTMLESYVWEAHKAHTLESLAFRHVGRTALTYEDVCGKGANQIPFAQVEVEPRRRLLVRGRRHGAARASVALAADRGRPGPGRRLSPDRDADLGGARPDRAHRRSDRFAAARGAEPGTRRAHGRARAGGVRDRRPAVQPRQPEADRRDPVRQARPAGRPKDGERRAVDRRGRAAGARRRLSAARASCSSTAACRS